MNYFIGLWTRLLDWYMGPQEAVYMHVFIPVDWAKEDNDE